MSEETNSVKIAILEQRMNDFYNVINKLDSAIEKISEVNTNIIKMLAVHEEKISQNERSEGILSRVNDEIRAEASSDRKDINTKLEAAVDKINTKIDDLNTEIDDLKKYKYFSILLGAIASLLVAGGFQVISGLDLNFGDSGHSQESHPAPLTRTP